MILVRCFCEAKAPDQAISFGIWDWGKKNSQKKAFARLGKGRFPCRLCQKPLDKPLLSYDTIYIVPKITIDTNEFCEPTEAAQLIGIGYATLYRWIKAGKLIPIRIAGRTLIPKSEIGRLKKGKNNNQAAKETA